MLVSVSAQLSEANLPVEEGRGSAILEDGR
jgi:hypothetical protein